MEDLKINTVFNMHCEQQSTRKRSCALIKMIKERTRRNITHQRMQGNSQAPEAQAMYRQIQVQGNSQAPQTQAAHQQVKVQETQTTTPSRKIQRSTKHRLRDTYWTKTSKSSLIDD
jgi:protein-disulfide isomerase